MRTDAGRASCTAPFINFFSFSSRCKSGQKVLQTAYHHVLRSNHSGLSQLRFVPFFVVFQCLAIFRFGGGEGANRVLGESDN